MDRQYMEMLKSLLRDEKIEKIDFIEDSGDDSARNFKIKGKQSAISTEIMRRFRIQNKKLLEQVALLKGQLKEASSNQKTIMEDIKQLMRINKELSAALGSCAECWGEDPECDQCKGLGSPGWKPSHQKHFSNYVAPILGKLVKKNGA